MDDLIEALTIFRKYTGNSRWPTICEHDVLHVLVKADDVSEKDKKLLNKLSFVVDEDTGNFSSLRFGSA